MELFIMVVIAVTYLVNSQTGALLLFLVVTCDMLARKGNVFDKLLRTIVYATPYYPFSLWGDRQRLSLCIVAVAVFCILLTFKWIKRGARVSVTSARKLLLLVIFFSTYFCSVIGSHIPKETIFATYQLVILAYLIFIIPICKNKELRYVKMEPLMQLFIKGICAIAITLYVQYGANVLANVQLGELYEYNSGREVYNVYFYAKSVLSLYLSIGMLYFFIKYINNKRLVDIFLIIFLGGGLLVNNSRTGLACFAICAVMYCIFNFQKIIGSIRIVVLWVLVGVAGLYVIQFMLESRENLIGIADDNGRIDTIVKAISSLPNYLLIGIGGSEMDFLLSNAGMAVHNFFISYLLQFGVLGGMAVNLLLISPAIDIKKKKWVLLHAVIIGGMLFANWHNALYIVPVYIFVLLDDGEQKTTQYDKVKGYITTEKR